MSGHSAAVRRVDHMGLPTTHPALTVEWPVYAGAIQSGRETRIDDAAATPRAVGSGCYRRERWRSDVSSSGRAIGATSAAIGTLTTWHAWRHHVDLCRTATALCRGC